MVHNEEDVLALEDVSGKVPVHVLVVPKEHVSSLAKIGGQTDALRKRLFEVAQEVAEKMDFAESGYAFRINNGTDGGREVFHRHAHVMGGKGMEMS